MLLLTLYSKQLSVFSYQLVYLSSRAIGQSYSTKKYLQSVAQNAKFLPDGPLLLSPTSVLMAFRRYYFLFPSKLKCLYSRNDY